MLNFEQNDPHLAKLAKMPYIFSSKILNQLSFHIPGIYTLSGGRQIGKTTLLKQWMHKLLLEKFHANSIYFMSGEVINDHIHLIHEIENILNELPVKILIIDEITYINNWDKGMKFLADAGKISNIVVVLTGSDSLIIQEARMRFPGRRGCADQCDFHYFPLSFNEVVSLKKGNNLLEQFNQYQIHGGYLTAINEYKTLGKISTSTYQTYSDWVRGDIQKKNKQENYLRSIIRGIIKRYGSQLTWNSLAKELPINHPSTIIDYVQLLKACDVCIEIESLIEEKLSGAPKKARKIFFTDPFIMQALAQWANVPILDGHRGSIVESIVLSHFKRNFSTFYINAEGEVDVAYIKGKEFYPIEVKWTEQIRVKDLKQIRKYKNGEIWGKNECLESIPPIYFLPQKLMDIK